MNPWSTFVSFLATGLFLVAQAFGGNMALAILTFSFFTRLSLLPLTIMLANRSRAQQQKLKTLQPHIDQLRTRYRNSPPRLAEEMRKVYEKYDYRPLDGVSVLGSLVQLPLFVGLFAAIRRGLTASGRCLWIADIAQPDVLLTLLVASLTYVSTLLASRLSGQNQTWLTLLPVILTLVFLWRLAAGIGLYWASSTLVSILQSLYLQRKNPREQTS